MPWYILIISLLCNKYFKASGRGSVGSTHSAIHLENPESHLRWYFKYFLGTGDYLHFYSYLLYLLYTWA